MRTVGVHKAVFFWELKVRFAKIEFFLSEKAITQRVYDCLEIQRVLKEWNARKTAL